MKMTAQDLMGLGVIDEIVLEPEGGAHLAPAIAIRQVDQVLRRQLAELSKKSGTALAAERYEKFRKIGAGKENT